MEIIETVLMENLPNDIKLVEGMISSAYGEFLAKNSAQLKAIEITFIAGTPSKTIRREVK